MWRIDTSQVPPAKLSDPRCAERLAEANQNLSNSDFVRAVCIHEVAHQIYWQRIGVETAPNYNVELHYDDRENRFVLIYASTEFLTDTSSLETTVHEFARAHASGGAAAEALTNTEMRYVGDEADFANFTADVGVGLLSEVIDLRNAWSRAREAVKLELRAPDSTLRDEILNGATKFEVAFRSHSQLI